MRGGLVEDEEPRLLRERAREHRALTLTAAQLVERDGRQVQHPRRLHRHARNRTVGLALEVAIGVVRIASHEHELLDRERKRLRQLLRHHGHVAREHRPGQRRERPSRQKDLAARRAQDACEQTDQRRLAGAVRSDHADDLSGLDRHRQRREPEGARPPPARRRVRKRYLAELDERAHRVARYRVRSR